MDNAKNGQGNDAPFHYSTITSCGAVVRGQWNRTDSNNESSPKQLGMLLFPSIRISRFGLRPGVLIRFDVRNATTEFQAEQPDANAAGV